MSLELLMNEDGTLAHAAGSPISAGAFVIVSSPSANLKASGKGVYSGDLLYTFSGGNAAGFVPGSVVSVGPQTISPTAVNVKSAGNLVIREGDSGTMSCSGTLTAGGPGSVSGDVEVSAAGQSNAKGQ